MLGTDAIRPFDLDLARRLLALEPAALLAWLDAELPRLRERTRRGAAEVLEALARALPPAERAALPPLERFVGLWDELRTALAVGVDPAEVAVLRQAVAEKAAFEEARVEVDGRAALALVLGGRAPEGSLSSQAVFPGDPVERYALLSAEHLEALAAAHRRLTPGAPVAAAGLAALAARCRAEPGLRGAYLFQL